MNKEELDILVNTIKDSLFHLESNKCNINTEENYWETFYGLSDDLIEYIRKIEKENKQLKEIIKEIKYYNQYNGFEVNTRDYGNLTVVDADELAIFIEVLERRTRKGDSNE